MDEVFEIKLKAVVREIGVVFIAMAEKDVKTGQNIIWKESKYLEDAFRDLDREIKRVVYNEELLKEPPQKQEQNK